MVTRINKDSKDSKEESNFKTQLAKRAAERVTAAIKSRTESFVTLQQAAASAFLFGVQFGRFEQFNRLFTELAGNAHGRIDADALRQRFVWRVIEKYGQGGVPAKVAPDTGDVLSWTVRPVSFISYRQTPPENEKGQHFFLTKPAGKSQEAETKRKLIKAGKDAVIAAGEEGLESIDWIAKGVVERGDSTYDAADFRKELSRVLARALKAKKADPEIKIEISTIRAIMRDAGFEKKESVPINTLIESMNQNQPATVARTPSNESEPPATEDGRVPATAEQVAA